MHQKGCANIFSLSYVDLMIECGFGENYAKHFVKFINNNFNYISCDCYIMNVNIIVKLIAFNEPNKYYPIHFTFNKNQLSKTIDLEINTPKLDELLKVNYDSYNTFLEVIDQIVSNDKFNKIIS